MNIFERAIRNKLRFPSNKGEITTEQLLDVPLRSRDGFNLDGIARSINLRLKDVQEGSFVDQTPSDTVLQLKMDVVKAVIEEKKRREEAAEKAAETKARNKVLQEALAKKQLAATEAMSAEEIEQLLAEGEESLAEVEEEA